MKITSKQLKDIIIEELRNVVTEANDAHGRQAANEGQLPDGSSTDDYTHRERWLIFEYIYGLLKESPDYDNPKKQEWKEDVLSQSKLGMDQAYQMMGDSEVQEAVFVSDAERDAEFDRSEEEYSSSNLKAKEDRRRQSARTRANFKKRMADLHGGRPPKIRWSERP